MVPGHVWKLFVLQAETVDDVGQHHDDEERQRTIIVAFLAGAMSMGFLWLLRALWHAVPDTLLEHGDDDNLTWIDPWNVPSKIIFSRIGELPISFKRTHWPWETIRRKMSSGGGSEGTNADGTVAVVDEGENPKPENGGSSLPTRKEAPVVETVNGDDDDNSVSHDAKYATAEHEGNAEPEKKLCIGSIFGLDVGGTLGKLVYFEQKTAAFDPLQSSLRDRNFVRSTSKHHSLKARLSAPAGRGAFYGGASAAAATMYEKQGSIPTLGSHQDSDNSNSRSIAGSKPHYLVRRRSLSVGFMGRLKQIQKEKEQEEQERKYHDEHQQCGSDYEMPTQHRSEQNFNRVSAASGQDNEFRKTRHSADFVSMESETFNQIFSSHEDENDEYQNGHLETPIASKPKRCISMVDLTSQSQQLKAEALDRFYSFARRLDSFEDAVRDEKLSFYSRELGGQFHFIRFETRRMSNAMDLIRYNNLHLDISEMGATGGGAHKFAEVWERELGIRMDKQEELDSLVAGMQFVLSTVVGECYTFRPHTKDGIMRATSAASSVSLSSASGANDEAPGPGQASVSSNDALSELRNIGSQRNVDDANSTYSDNTNTTEDTPVRNNSSKTEIKVDEWWWSRKVQRDAISYSSAYPYMLVTIGTGVSVLRVDGPRQHERVSGSTIGGGTYWGLMRLLTDVESFDDAMMLAEKGDPSKIDMMVGDIYGKNSDALDKLGLTANVVASSFGKLVAKDDPAEGLTQEDLARALLLMVTNNIGQVSYLNAKLYNTRRIYFVGSFLRQNTISQRRLSYAIDYWSKGEMEALFLEHEGYFGALGAFLMSQKIEEREEGFFQWDANPNPSAEAFRRRKSAFLERFGTFAT